MLTIKNLTVEVEGKMIVGGVDLAINLGEVVVLMGPNGSGKSTLANALAGNPKYQINQFKIQNYDCRKTGFEFKIDGEDVTKMGPEERSKRGLFLVNQYPVAIPGLSSQSFLWQLHKKHNPNSKISLVEFRKMIGQWTNMLGLGNELLKRGLNDGFSGGEKKKMEILQLMVCNPKYVILDEVDSGLDVDALKNIAMSVAKMVSEQKIGVLIITHYSRILKYIKPDKVIIMKNGLIEKTGGIELINEVEADGFEANETEGI